MSYPRIKTELLLRGITLNTLASKMSITVNDLSDKLDQKSDFTLQEVEMILEVCKPLSFSYLFYSDILHD